MENQSTGPSAARPAGMANLRFGVYNQPTNVAGKSAQEAREQFSKIWGIPNDSIAYKGKDKLDENYIIQPGDNVEFHRRAGEKG